MAKSKQHRFNSGSKNLIRFPTIAEIKRLCIDVKRQILPEYRAHEDDDEPGILLTVGADGKGGWSYQTGDTQ